MTSGDKPVHGRRCGEDDIVDSQPVAHELAQVIERVGSDAQNQVIAHGIGCHDLTDCFLVGDHFLVIQDHALTGD